MFFPETYLVSIRHLAPCEFLGKSTSVVRPYLVPKLHMEPEI